MTRLPPLVILLGFAGLLPFLAGPAWLTWAPHSAPALIDHVWLSYGALIASFMAGTFWGFALPAAEGDEGKLGMLIASVLMLITWAATALPMRGALYTLIAVFALLLLADIWRERVLGSVEGYFFMRALLTLGVIATIGWRLALAA